MKQPADKKSLYKILAVVFGIAGLIWVVYGLMSPHFLFYPFLGLVNLGLAFLCFQNAK